MKRWQMLLFALVCFSIGALSATVYEGVAQDGRTQHGHRALWLADQLTLTEQQRVRLDEIVEDARHRMVSLSQQTKPRFRKIKQETRDQIRAILDAEQLATFNDICNSCDLRKRN